MMAGGRREARNRSLPALSAAELSRFDHLLLAYHRNGRSSSGHVFTGLRALALFCQ
jgi:hypothetical protein